ncbi:MAG TPA: hypothetical protein VLH75_20510 [Longimicrobiales bacterium]|nr:hypothetical protein [Longimicrobiales bacterium]
MTSTMTGAAELQDAERRLAALENQKQQAEAELRQVRTDFANGQGGVEMVTEAEGRVSALRGTVENLTATVRRLRREHADEAESARVDGLVEAYRESGRELSAMIREFGRLTGDLRAAALRIQAAEEVHGRRGLELTSMDALPRNLTGADVPEETWRKFGGLGQYYRQTLLPGLRNLSLEPIR